MKEAPSEVVTLSLKRALGVWAVLAVAMSANGMLRESVLVRLLGRAAAGVVSAALGIAIILTTALRLLAPRRAASASDAARVSGLWVAATIVFEFAIGRFVDRKSWRELLENYAVWRGQLWPLVLLAVALAPFLARSRAAQLHRVAPATEPAPTAP